MVEILYTNMSMNHKCFNDNLNKLPDNTKKSILKFYRWEDRYSALIGKLLLLKGLKNLGFHDLTIEDLNYTKNNRPYFDAELDFNISHSHSIVVCVLSSTVKLGIDVERIVPIDTTDFKSQFTSLEWNEIIHAGATNFFRFWTRKEAVLKADGRGLTLSMNEIDIREDSVVIGNNTWYLYEVPLHRGYSCHLATDALLDHKDFSFKVESWSGLML
jgi:4'-phosphopantetheinyl transferase